MVQGNMLMRYVIVKVPYNVLPLCTFPYSLLTSHALTFSSEEEQSQPENSGSKEKKKSKKSKDKDTKQKLKKLKKKLKKVKKARKKAKKKKAKSSSSDSSDSSEEEVWVEKGSKCCSCCYVKMLPNLVLTIVSQTTNLTVNLLFLFK